MTQQDETSKRPVDREDEGREVTIRGTALDAHAGAMLVRDGAPDVFISGLTHWPPEARGRTVEATGVLRSRKLSPAPAVSDQGVVTHGMSGDALVLEDADWKLAD